MPFRKEATLVLLLLSTPLVSAPAAETPLPEALATPGETIVLYATGLGLVGPEEAKQALSNGEIYQGPPNNDPDSYLKTMARIDDANRRILTKKFELGLFERPLTDRSYTSTVGSAAHRSLARQAVTPSSITMPSSPSIKP